MPIGSRLVSVPCFVLVALLPMKAHSEREGCFVTYYDLTGKIPDRFLGANGDTFFYKRIEARQDPLSHHAVVIPYHGTAEIHDTVWGGYTCGGGAKNGDACEPTDLDSCGAEGVCGSEFKPAVACIGYGPGDASIGVGNDSLFNTMAAGLGSVDGIYAEQLKLDRSKFEAAFNSHTHQATIMQLYQDSSNGGVNQTPTFVIDGKAYYANELRAAIDAALTAKQ